MYFSRLNCFFFKFIIKNIYVKTNYALLSRFKKNQFARITFLITIVLIVLLLILFICFKICFKIFFLNTNTIHLYLYFSRLKSIILLSPYLVCKCYTLCFFAISRDFQNLFNFQFIIWQYALFLNVFIFLWLYVNLIT